MMIEKKKSVGILIILLLSCFVFPAFIFSETIVFKSGEELKGYITEKTAEYIRLCNYNGSSGQYRLEDIERIDWRPLKEEDYSSFSGGDGSSFEKAIILKHNPECDNEGGWSQEYSYIKRKFGIEGKDWEIVSKKYLSNEKNYTPYEEISIKLLSSKKEIIIYFNIDNCLFEPY